MGFLFGQPKIQGDERQKCLAYLKEEFKISALDERERQLFQNAILECSLEAKHEGMYGKELDERMSGASNRLAKAAEQIMKRRAKFVDVPDVALPTCSAWQRVYSAYSAWATEQPPQPELFQQYEKYKAEAAREHYKLLKRLKLSDDEAQELFNYALAELDETEN